MTIRPEGSEPSDKSTREAQAALADTPDYDPNLRWWAFTGQLYDVRDLDMTHAYPSGYVLTCKTCAFRLDDDRRPTYRMSAGENAAIHERTTGEDAVEPRDADHTIVLLEYEDTLYRLQPGSDIDLMEALRRNGHPDSQNAHFLLDDAHIITPQRTGSYVMDADSVDELVPDNNITEDHEKRVIICRNQPFGRYMFEKSEVANLLSNDDRVSYLDPVGDF